MISDLTLGNLLHRLCMLVSFHVAFPLLNSLICLLCHQFLGSNDRRSPQFAIGSSSMASHDHISQFTQDIPPTQPDRSLSRTPHREHHPTPQMNVPQFRGPLHQASRFRPMQWQPPGIFPPPGNLPFAAPPCNQFYPPTGHSPAFPPLPPTCPPPPPPGTPLTPQRMYTTIRQNHLLEPHHH